MRKLQKQYSADFKARVVVSALREDRTLNPLRGSSDGDYAVEKAGSGRIAWRVFGPDDRPEFRRCA